MGCSGPVADRGALFPVRRDKEKLRQCLMTAINNAEGFGLM